MSGLSGLRRARAKLRKAGRAPLRASTRAALESLERRLCLSGFLDIESDVSQAEGNGGSTTFNFRVTWNNPGAFDVGAQVRVFTANGTATVADNDYVPFDNVIAFEKPFGSTLPVTRIVSVQVVGDTRVESDEFFTLNLGNATPNVAIRATPKQGIIRTEEPPVITGTAGNDTLNINATGPTSGTFSLNGAAPVAFSNVLSLTFNGGTGNDVLRISNPTEGLFAPPQGIDYNGGGQAGDSLENLGGLATSGTYSVGPTTDAGTLTHTGGSVTQTIRFTGLAPLLDTVGEGTFTVVGTDAGNTITLDNGTSAADGRLRVTIDSFEPVQFANKANLVVNADPAPDSVSDTVIVAFTEAASLSSLTVNSGQGPDTIRILATPSGVTTTINAAGGNDTVALANGVSLQGGRVDGGADIDLLDYSAFTTAVQVNLGQNAQFRADLEGEQENPSTPSTATATGVLTYNAVTRTFDLTMTVVGIAAAEPNLRFHIHQQAVGVNGGIIVDFFNRANGVDSPNNIGAITPTADGFVYQANGVTLPAVNEASLFAGNTYLNIHTTAFPGGEIRGQLAQQTPSAAASGTATGTGGVSNVEDVTGGSGNDGLVGNSSANILRGGGGNDILVGGQGGDNLLGGEGSDILAWNNGDGSDVMDGESGTDTVLVNGTTTAGDVFTVAANGTRMDLDRISPGPFSLDIGTTETLTQVGHGGGDNMTILSLAGVSDLQTINLFGVLGDDNFNISNAATTTNIRAGSGNDTVTLAAGANLGTGTVNGSLGTDLLDYSAFTTAVQVNLGQNAQFRADLAGEQENPPTPSAATGNGTFTYNAVTRTIDIALTVVGIAASEPNLRFHIHQQAVGVNGGIIVDLFNRAGGGDNPNNIGTITPTPDGFTYAATGVLLPAVNEGSLFAGNTYFNIHTTAFPGGEIRGQIAQQTPSAAASGTATATGGVSNVENVTGGSGNDGLVGNPSANTLNGLGGNDIVVGGQGGDNLLGGEGSDILAWNNGDGSDVTNGEGGADTVLVNGTTTAGDVFETSANGTRVFFRRITPGPFTLDIGTTETLTQVGHGGDDSMTVLNLAGVADLQTINLFGVIGDDTFTVNNAATATNVRAGSGNDTITLGSGASLGTGTVNGSLGTDLLDYSAFTTAVQVNLGQNAQFRADLAGEQENPPTPSAATAAGTVTYNAVTRTLDITMTVVGIAATEPNLRFHIHQQAVGVNGGILVDLFNRAGGVDNPNNIGTITPTADGFTYTATGVPLPAVNEASLFAGNTYLNIHTMAFPGGEIRGQLAQQTPSAAASGTATGTGGIINLEDVTGGSGNDGLVGSPVANVLRGLGGNDILVGGQGGDHLLGGEGSDLLAWSNGDGSDVMEGEGGTDTVLVNGTTTAGDVFETSANGTRVAFRRVTPGPFTLDIGSSETLTQVGHGGGDTMTILDLAGVADLATINFHGLGGSDTFNVSPQAAVTINVNGHSPIAPALPGDAFNLNLAGATSPVANFIHTPDGFQGNYTFGNRQPVNFRQVETGLTVPRVTAIAFRNDAAPHTLEYSFSEDVFATLSVNDLRVENLSTREILPPKQVALVQDPRSRTAIFTFPGFARGILPDGRWRATLIAPGITNSLAVPLDGDADLNPGGDHVFNFHHLIGDANGDAAVGFPDLVRLAQNYNTTNKTFSDGDFDYDRDVDFGDLVILAQRYNTSLPTAAAQFATAQPTAAPLRPTPRRPLAHPKPFGRQPILSINPQPPKRENPPNGSAPSR